MSTRVNDPKTSAMVIVMQRCHRRDLSGHLLEKGSFEHLCLPAEYEGPGRTTSIGFSVPRAQLGELLWPERFGPKEIADLKISLGSYSAADQLQQRPSPTGGGIFKRHWFRYFQPRGANLPAVLVRLPDGTQTSIPSIEVPHQVEEQLQSWDCAFKDLDTSDYVVGQMWGRLGPRFFLGDQVRGRMDCPGTVRAVRDMRAKWPGTIAILIEDKANGSAVIQMLSHDIPGILPVNPGGGRVARAQAISPLVDMSRFMLQLFAASAEMEREIIRERVRAGVRNAKAKETRLGRPQRVFRRAEAQRLRRDGLSWREIARVLQVPMSTVIDACRSGNT